MRRPSSWRWHAAQGHGVARTTQSRGASTERPLTNLTILKTRAITNCRNTRSSALAGGALEKTLGKLGGSVKIQKVDGKFQEECTYPGSADPKKSKG